MLGFEHERSQNTFAFNDIVDAYMKISRDAGTIRCRGTDSLKCEMEVGLKDLCYCSKILRLCTTFVSNNYNENVIQNQEIIDVILILQ